MGLATFLCIVAVILGNVGRWIGSAFIVALSVYLVFTFVSERRTSHSAASAVYEAEADAVPGKDYSLGISITFAIGGLLITMLGARFLISGAVSAAQAAGVSETVLGLTIVAIGTSMPELVTSLIAVRKGQGDVVLGNVLGSNIFNILGILGITAIVQPMAVLQEIIRLDIWVMSAATLLLIIVTRIGRREGGAMLLCYVAYLGWSLA